MVETFLVGTASLTFEACSECKKEDTTLIVHAIDVT
jgi:hypothetical protein